MLLGQRLGALQQSGRDLGDEEKGREFGKESGDCGRGVSRRDETAAFHARQSRGCLDTDYRDNKAGYALPSTEFKYPVVIQHVLVHPSDHR